MSDVGQMTQVSQVKLVKLPPTVWLFWLPILLLIYYALLQFFPKKKFQNCKSY
jgi:hypothetical protein